MQHKLKAALRSSRRKKSLSAHSADDHEHHQASSPHGDTYSASSSDGGRASLEAPTRNSQHNARSRPLSSTYDNRRTSNASAPQSANADHAQYHSSDPNTGAIASDYRSYLPVLHPVDDSRDEQQITMGRDRRLIARESDGRHGEDVADRNIGRNSSSLDADRAKPLPAIPASTKASHSARTDAQVGWNNRRPHGSESDNEPSRSLPIGHTPRGNTIRPSGHGATIRTVENDGAPNTKGVEDWKLQQQSLLEGVVDLRDTVETHRDTTWAPAVTHEVIKPHEHEIIQQKLYREIHNYSYYHRLQPVMHTEVLPPRHFIPNPDGEGLIEISADELPTRTGQNRWWDIVQKEVPFSAEQMSQKWRTEPEIIKGKPYITDEGFERTETTIIYPPTLADLSTYKGQVQPVHFDHKTGERWLGQVTTMDRLMGDLDDGQRAEPLSLKELSDNLPDMPPSPTIKRKPVGVEPLSGGCGTA